MHKLSFPARLKNGTSSTPASTNTSTPTSVSASRSGSPRRNMNDKGGLVLRANVIKVGGLSKEEARSIMEYYAESGMLRAKVDDGFVSEKWSLAGMGNIGELERASVRLRI